MSFMLPTKKMISGPGYFLIFVMTCWLILYTKDSMARSDSALEAITLFIQQLNRIALYSCEKILKSVRDFVFMALFKNHKLYQFVLTQERADDITKCELVTKPALVSQPMRDGVH
ncbi:hypothetical protein pdam_00022854 [Pocillopora damicornis]|uniref:Uncharacterized protein n=2 Tax=Pocillopora TaxID=46730 RepID=A0A3M6UNU9_POCDA|nr:hypothetical protein pdam_00022854 [Pocillopora damicornis]CAH3159591.1 unnamed protein product [Pocillopora meandrina]